MPDGGFHFLYFVNCFHSYYSRKTFFAGTTSFDTWSWYSFIFFIFPVETPSAGNLPSHISYEQYVPRSIFRYFSRIFDTYFRHKYYFSYFHRRFYVDVEFALFRGVSGNSFNFGFITPGQHPRVHRPPSSSLQKHEQNGLSKTSRFTLPLFAISCIFLGHSVVLRGIRERRLTGGRGIPVPSAV